MSYVFGLYGPTESEVKSWGVIEVIIGVVMFGLTYLGTKFKTARIFHLLVLAVNILMQVLPVVLWFAFNGRGISDGTPVSEFVASWSYSLTHILIGLLSFVCMVFLVDIRRSTIKA
jgi:hypothetical protein